MSRTLYRPPIYRQILPWLFVILFFILAPVIVFYTDGYRYNPKKGRLERNGGLILASNPKGANIFIDGVDTRETTPVTLQNIQPGFHNIRLNKAGFRPWNKTLEVRPEQITFADHIHLWINAEPILLKELPAKQLAADTLGQQLLVLTATTTTSVMTWSPDAGFGRAIALPDQPTSSRSFIDWNETGDAWLLNGRENGLPTFIGNVRGNPPLVSRLPGNVWFSWNPNAAAGVYQRQQFTVNAASHAVQVHPLPETVEDALNQLRIERATSSHEIIVDASHPSRLYLLPDGDWRFADPHGTFDLAHDQERWLAFDLSQRQQPLVSEGSGDYPRWLSTKTDQALLLRPHELWLWPLPEPAHLIWRQAEPLVQAIWHRSGDVAFVASKTDLFSLEIHDPLDQTATPLAQFQEIFDVASLGKELYIAGVKNGIHGIWTLAIE